MTVTTIFGEAFSVKQLPTDQPIEPIAGVYILPFSEIIIPGKFLVFEALGRVYGIWGKKQHKNQMKQYSF